MTGISQTFGTKSCKMTSIIEESEKETKFDVWSPEKDDEEHQELRLGSVNMLQAFQYNSKPNTKAFERNHRCGNRFFIGQ